MTWSLRKNEKGHQVLRDGMVTIFPVAFTDGKFRLAIGKQLPDHVELRDTFTQEEAEAILAKMQEMGKDRATLNPGKEERS